MKSKLSILCMAALLLATALPALGAGSLANLKGKCVDEQGQPIADAQIQMVNVENGQKYTLKTDKKGEYFNAGIQPGNYKMTLVKDGQQLFFFNNVPVTLAVDENVVDFDLGKIRAGKDKNVAAAPKPKEEQAKAAEQQKQVTTVKALNEKLVAAKAAADAGNPDQAVAIIDEALAMNNTFDLVWFNSGVYHTMAGSKATEKDAKTAHFDKAIAALQKAIELHPKTPDATGADPKLGGFHNELGNALAKGGKPKEALMEYTAAAQTDPANAARYYFNGGAILTNMATRETDQTVKAKDIEEANTSFDKAVAAKPDYADAYYQKGVNLMNNASIKENKVVAPAGTAEAFNKYLELQPQGPHAEDAKQILASMGEAVQTSFKQRKEPKKK